MPNGGPDSCGTCWFNATNHGKAGHVRDRGPGPDFCTIRSQAIDNPFYTYCGNHPSHRPDQDSTPIGPVFIGDSRGSRVVWTASPDSEEIRQHLLTLLSQIEAQPRADHLFGIPLDTIAVWQLGEFRETRAVEGLRRVVSFRPDAAAAGPVGHNRQGLVRLAREALEKIERRMNRDTVGDLAARMQVVEGDITRLHVIAIVNAANQSLLGGGGVDGAIHAAAGPRLLDECRTLGGCPVGQARMTSGHRLLARHVIHTVGPVYQGGRAGEAALLASCYRESLRLATEAGLDSVAFPCISTGVFGYPMAAACDIAVATVADWLATHDVPRVVTFCCFSGEDAELYRARLADWWTSALPGAPPP